MFCTASKKIYLRLTYDTVLYCIQITVRRNLFHCIVVVHFSEVEKHFLLVLYITVMLILYSCTAEYSVLYCRQITVRDCRCLTSTTLLNCTIITLRYKILSCCTTHTVLYSLIQYSSTVMRLTVLQYSILQFH